jgi:hypothetical protein
VAEIRRVGGREHPAPTDGARRPRAIQAALNDGRPKVFLPGDDRPMSEVATELGKHLADRLYVHNGEIVKLAGSVLRKVDAQTFRTLAEEAVLCCRQRTSGHGSVQVEATMTADESRGILSAPQFRAQLRHVARVNTVRLPTIRRDGRIELLPEGYDAESQTVTIPDAVYPEDTTFESGVAVINDLFGEFEFADGKRSLSVAVTALVGLFAAQLVDVRSLRPVYAFTKNAPGAGATLLASCAVVPVLGHMPSSVKPDKDEEMEKVLMATLRAGKAVLVLDNAKGHLDLPALERFTTSTNPSGRILGLSEVYEGENNVTVFVTANGMTVTGDMRRRMLFAELHLSAERPENRLFKRKLDVTELIKLRPRILAACWALVRHWDAQGRPDASRTHSFPSWDAVVGGIVEAAGFGCPFAPAAAASVADEDGDSMRSMVMAMEPGRKYAAQELAELCRKESAFINIVGDGVVPMTVAQRSAFGWALSRWDKRQIGNHKFFIDGNGRHKRFRIELVKAERTWVTVGNGITPLENKARTHVGG